MTNILNTKINGLVKKTNYDTKIGEIEKKKKKKITDLDHAKYITTQELNNLTPDSFK